MIRENFKILVIDLSTRKADVVMMEGRNTVAGGSGLAAKLFYEFGKVDKPWDDPDQPLIFAIGPLTGYFPLMSKTVYAFKSPYHDQYAESHAGGRSALSMRFTDYDAIVIKGKASTPSCVYVGSRHFVVKDVHYLWGTDVQVSGKVLRKMFKGAGHRSIMRIGPAGENHSPIACVNVDTFRHFGRLGGGGAMGAKNLKAIVIQGDASFELPPNKEYPQLFQEVYKLVTSTKMMSKYHDIGTAINVAILNDLKSLPWFNLKQTYDASVNGITGEKFADDALFRNVACSGCPVGCIHIGFVREKFMKENRYLYRQVSYDHEPIFSTGSMLGIKSNFSVLGIIDAVEKMGLDVMSTGVALAWATEAFEKGLISDKETIVPLKFGNAENYKLAINYIGNGINEFYRMLNKGTLGAVKKYGGEDFACVLGQEMAGYATGEVFFTSQLLGFRHSHLDAGGYSYDQMVNDKDITKAIEFLVTDEQERVFLTSMVACLFARGVYTKELLARCLRSVGYIELAENIEEVSKDIQRLRWKLRLKTGYDPSKIRIPKRFYEVVNWKGPIDKDFFDGLRNKYQEMVINLATEEIKFSSRNINTP